MATPRPAGRVCVDRRRLLALAGMLLAPLAPPTKAEAWPTVSATTTTTQQLPVRWPGVEGEFHLTDRQRGVVAALVDALLDGEDPEVEDGPWLRDLFAGSGVFGKLLVPGKRLGHVGLPPLPRDDE